MTPVFPVESAREVVRRALDEDLGADGDVTTQAVVPRGSVAHGVVVAREELVVAGLPLVPLVMDEVRRWGGGPVAAEALVSEGGRVDAGARMARLEGDAWTLLGGERVLLNLLSRLSGVASLTAACVAEIAGTGCTVADTRKTTPGLRALEKYAVALAGGENHRSGLDAMVLAKDNHKYLAGGAPALIERLRRSGCDLAAVEVEVEDLDEFDVALAAGVGWILLDNFDIAAVREAARRAAAHRPRPGVRLEASGGLAPGRLRPYAEAGVNRLSLGVLTHGARAADIALDFEKERP